MRDERGQRMPWISESLEDAAPDLLAAARLTLDLLRNMSTEAFSQGADRPARLALIAAVYKATGDAEEYHDLL